jgi:hypothetical protein
MAGEQADTTQPGGAEPSQADALKLWNEVAAEAAQEPPATLETAPEDNAGEATPAKTEVAAGEKPAQVDPDPFAGLSPAVVERLKRLDTMETQLAQLPGLQRSLSEAQGRVAAVQRELDQARAAAKAVDVAPSASQIAAASKSTAKWSALKADFPEWADATQEYVEASLAGLTPQQTAGLTPEQVEARIEQRVQAALQQAEHEKVADRHEDWQATVKTPEFQTWYRAQDQNTQALAQSPKARDAIRMLDLFQRAKEAPADRVAEDRTSRLAAAVTSKPNAAGKPAGKTPESMSPAELWEFERKNAAKRASGLTY